jgi:hypothetical protein
VILGKQKSGTPGKWDLLLANAETILDLERCPQCNQPKYVCQNEDPDIEFRVYDETCHATAKRVRYEKSKADSKGRDGVAVGVEAYTHSGTPLDQFRGPFYEIEYERRREREAARPIIPREHPPGWKPETSE